jgi:hypothetical protein
MFLAMPGERAGSVHSQDLRLLTSSVLERRHGYEVEFPPHCQTFRSGHLRPMTIPPWLSGAAHKLVVGQGTEITSRPGIGGQIPVHAAPLKVGRSFPAPRQFDDDIGVHDPHSPRPSRSTDKTDKIALRSARPWTFSRARRPAVVLSRTTSSTRPTYSGSRSMHLVIERPSAHPECAKASRMLSGTSRI